MNEFPKCCASECNIQNTIVAKLICKGCGTMTVGLWYTKRGREQRMCMKCGEYLDIKGER